MFTTVTYFHVRKFTLIELLMIIAIIAILAGLLIPALQTARGKTQQIICANNMKQINTAISMYAQDYNDSLISLFGNSLTNATTFYAMLGPYLGWNPPSLSSNPPASRIIFRCPAWSLSTGYGCNRYHGISDAFSGNWKKLSRCPAPAKIFCLGEKNDTRDYYTHLFCVECSPSYKSDFGLCRFSHSGKANFIFIDGHIDFLKWNSVTDNTDNLWGHNLSW